MQRNVDKSIYYLSECILNLSECMQNLPKIVDKSIDKLGAHMHIYGAIDKIPEIWCACGDMWSKMEHYGEFMDVAQLHIYQYVDK